MEHESRWRPRIGLTVDQAWAYIKAQGWRASVMISWANCEARASDLGKRFHRTRDLRCLRTMCC